MEPEFCTPIQIASWGGAEAEGFGVGVHDSPGLVPVLVLEEKAEYDDENEDEESFLGMKSSMKIIRNSS